MRPTLLIALFVATGVATTSCGGSDVKPRESYNYSPDTYSLPATDTTRDTTPLSTAPVVAVPEHSYDESDSFYEGYDDGADAAAEDREMRTPKLHFDDDNENDEDYSDGYDEGYEDG